MRWTFRARAYPNVRLALVSILLVRIPAVWHMKREGKKADRNTAETWENIAHYPSALLHNCCIYEPLTSGHICQNGIFTKKAE